MVPVMVRVDDRGEVYASRVNGVFEHWRHLGRVRRVDDNGISGRIVAYEIGVVVG